MRSRETSLPRRYHDAVVAWRQTFIPHDALREVRVGSGDPPNLRFLTDRGTVRIFPRMAQVEALAQHIRSLKKG